ncbi:unnamed protein product [Urochloa decumbens]|uniref:F-box domain-containing protein n=1 Tax=Urochloa decumbens TaxID=240449 RepID=A0ABC9BSC1_9POAL
MDRFCRTSAAWVPIKPEGASCSCSEAAEEVGIYFLQDSEQMFPESPIGMVNTAGCKTQRCSRSYIDRSNRNFQIHEFPEDILHKILSHLTFKEIAQTSILSSTWRQAWRSYPDLNFCRREMPVILDELLLLKEATIETMSGSDNLDYSFSTLLNAMPNLERLSLSLYMIRETKGWAVSPRDFIHLRYLKMEIHLHGQVECSSGLLRLVSLLEVAPLLEEMELHMCFCDVPITTLFNKLSKNRSRIQHSHLKTVYMTGFYGCKGQLELARYILENATALQRMTLDPISKMVHSKSLDASMRLKELDGRRNAKSFLARQKFSQILTIL